MYVHCQRDWTMSWVWAGSEAEMIITMSWVWAGTDAEMIITMSWVWAGSEAEIIICQLDDHHYWWRVVIMLLIVTWQFLMLESNNYSISRNIHFMAGAQFCWPSGLDICQWLEINLGNCIAFPFLFSSFLLLLHPPGTLYLLTFDCAKTFSLSNATWKPIYSNSLSPPLLHQVPLYLRT